MGIWRHLKAATITVSIFLVMINIFIVISILYILAEALTSFVEKSSLENSIILIWPNGSSHTHIHTRNTVSVNSCLKFSSLYTNILRNMCHKDNVNQKQELILEIMMQCLFEGLGLFAVRIGGSHLIISIITNNSKHYFDHIFIHPLHTLPFGYLFSTSAELLQVRISNRWKF